MKVIDLLNKIANGKASDITTNFMFGREKYNLLRFLDTYALDINSLNWEVEIIEEDKPKVIVEDTEGNKKEYGIDLSEGLVDGERIFKKDNKWYVQKIINEDSEFSQWLKQFEPTIYTIEEEKRIPEKIDIKIQNETTGNAYITNEKGTKCYLTKHSKIIAERLNQVIDYLKSKGE